MKSDRMGYAVLSAFAWLAASATLVAQMPDSVQKEFNALKQSVNSETQSDAWREYIMPPAADLKWKQIPWLPTFQEGIVKAAAEDKPVLLWTMNGHPLGCT